MNLRYVQAVAGLVLAAGMMPAVYAGNNMTYGVAARAQTMGSAFTAVADDSSAVYYNPAGLTQVKGSETQATLSPIFPSSSYRNAINGVTVSNHKMSLGGSGFFSQQLSDRVTFGFGVYSPFARATDYKRSPALYGYNFESKAVDLNVSPVLAFKVTDKFSIGFGPILNYNYLNVKAFGLRQKADGISWSGVASALYQVTDKWKIGATYHSSNYNEISGDGKGTAMSGLPVNSSLKVKYKNPAYANIGTALQATDKLLLSAGIGMEFWNQQPNVVFKYSNPALNNRVVFDSNDSLDIHTGLEYRFKPNQAVRLGYAFYQQAIPDDGVLPGALDFDVSVYSVGYSYYYQAWRFDVGYEYSHGAKVTSKSTKYNPFLGTFRGITHTVLLGANYQIA